MTAARDLAAIRKIELSIAAYTGLAALGAWWFYSLPLALGVVCGGSVTYLNFLVVAGLTSRVLRRQKKRYLLAYAAKSLALFGAVVGLIYYKLVDGPGLLLGLLSLFVAVAVAAGFALAERRSLL